MKQITFMTLLLALALPTMTQGQTPNESEMTQGQWGAEFRLGPSFATKDLGDASLGMGIGFEGTVIYRLMPHMSAYLGWSWNKFSAEESFAGQDMDFEETGYTFGLQFIHPLAGSRVNSLIRAGALYNHIETENSEGDIISNSGHGLGYQIETGIVFPVSDRLQLTPSVRYRSLSREITIGSMTKAVNLNYVSTGLGLSWSF